MRRLTVNLVCATACALLALGFGKPAERRAIAFAAGLAWVQLAEYAWHRGMMHGRWRCRLRRSHLAHHRAFSGRFAVGRREVDIQESISEHPSTFPVAFGIHAAVLGLALGGAPREFLVGICVGYMVYEVGHWMTHIADNPMDRALLRLPILGRVREAQIEHHRRHHAEPVGNFSFTPPYAGDIVFGTKR